MVKFEIDCDSIIPTNENIHSPKRNGWFMAATNLTKPSNWKNQDTIKLTTFTTKNLQNNMPLIVLNPPEKENKGIGEISFSSLIYFTDSGEYGENIDSSYYACFKMKNDILILKEKFWWSKGKGRKYKFQIVWIGRNCCQLIRLNPTNRKQLPKPIKNKDKNKITTVKNY